MGRQHVQNDPAVLDMIEKGRTRGIFYIESPCADEVSTGKALARSFEEIGITSSRGAAGRRAVHTKSFVERHRKMKRGYCRLEICAPVA